jgi:hypothetical protein
MEQWADIRGRVLIEGLPKREVLRETGMHWTTLVKILGSERLTGTLLDRFTHRMHILKAHGETHRLHAAKNRVRRHSSRKDTNSQPRRVRLIA